ncbi:MAG: L,D-transpeptidase [Bacilli bacterium]|nr:L,D-transpeptidase [Bacilli bacterium]
MNKKFKNISKLKINKRLIAFVLSGTLGVSGITIVKGISKNNRSCELKDIETIDINTDYQEVLEFLEEPIDALPIENVTYYQEPVVEIKEEIEKPFSSLEVQTPIKYNGGDSIVATGNVNMRLSSSTESRKIGLLEKGTICDRLYSINGWDLIKYNDQLSFVSSDYTKENDIDYNNEYYHIEDYNDIVRTTSVLNFRLLPSTKEKSLLKLDKNEELEVLGKAIIDSNNEVWLLAKASGKLGFVKEEYTKSLRKEIEKFDPSIGDIKILQMGYLNNDTELVDTNNNTICTFPQYELVEVLQNSGNRYLVNIDGKIGFVSKNAVKRVSGHFLVVDISSQRIYYYGNTDMIFKGKCTTGKKSTPTELGFYKAYAKGSSHEFPNGHSSEILWQPFNGGQGLHDAPWENEKDFGDYSYTKSQGSAGCVRLPDSVAEYIHDNTNMDSPILIKK